MNICKGYYCGLVEGDKAKEAYCNIEMGVFKFLNFYEIYGEDNIVYETEIRKKCTDEEHVQKYLNYQGWERSIRAYGSFDCSNSRNVNYVENVLAEMI